MTEYERGDKITLDKKHKDIMLGLHTILTQALSDYVLHFKEDFIDMPGGVENAMMTAVGKFSAGIIVSAIMMNPEQVDEVREAFVKLVNAEIKEFYEYRKKENLKSSH